MLRHRSEGAALHWVIGTESHSSMGFSEAYRARREEQIELATAHYGFTGLHRLGFTTTKLDVSPLGDMVAALTGVMQRVQPTTVYLPFRDDAHSDHRVLFDAAQASLKWFRNDALREILAYETLSETGYSLAPNVTAFRPTLYIDITPHLEGKLTAMAFYESEVGDHPFPRSMAAIRAQATLRGSECGCEAAEAFVILRQFRL